jgi:hypothetical protein
VKAAPFGFLAVAGLVLGGCQTEKLTLEQAQAQCTKKGGFLVVIYTQKITLAGLEPEVAHPGDCLSPKSYDTPAAKAPPANQPDPVK